MALVSTRTYTWAQLGSSNVTWGDTNPFLEWTGNGTTISGASTDFADLVYTSPVEDLGVSRTFYPTANVRSNGTGVTIAVQISADGSTGWSTQTLGAMTGRYIRFVVTIVNASATASLNQFEAEFFFDFIQETFDNLSISAGGTTLPIARNYSTILGINATGPHKFQVVLTDATKTAPVVTSYDLDTWGKVASATTADVTIHGFPNISADSSGNIVVS